MKTTPLLLVGSLAVNAVLLGFILFRQPADRVAPPVGLVDKNAPRAAAGADARHAALQAALASRDPAALAAAGCPPDLIRELTLGRAFDTFHTRLHKLRPSVEGGKYWQGRRFSDDPKLGRERQVEENRAQREFSQAVRRAYGGDADSIFEGRPRYDFLPAAKREQLHRIEDDYAEIEAQIQSSIENGIELPSDREKLAMLRREKERDIAAALTPEEREQMDLRTSNRAMLVQARYGRVLETEEDYKKIFALQKAFDERFSIQGSSTRPAPEAMQARREAEQKLHEEIQALLKPEQLAPLRNDRDRTVVEGLARRLALPANATDAVLALRERTAAQSLQINADPALSPEQRRAQLQNLATKSQTELQSALGQEGAEAYGQHSRWLNLLRNGNAFSTNPKDAPNPNHPSGPAIYQVPPPGTPARRTGPATGN